MMDVNNIKNRFLLGQTSGLINVLKSHLLYYPTPVNLPYIFSLGSILGIMLGVQILTGVLLSMHYVPHVDLAFDSVERIMRDVSMG
jgi:quinol-cytochrome oxidoreductase complex cytochrome b subunit